MFAPLFGLPFVTGSLPHSPQFVRALTKPVGRFEHVVYENRIAPLVMYFLIGGSLLFTPELIELIPEAAVDGILVVVGVVGLFECQLWSRLFLLITPSADFPSVTTTSIDLKNLMLLRHVEPLPEQPYTVLKPSQIHLFTGLQVLALIVAWAVNLSPIGLAFPFVICALIPFRLKLMPKWFDEHELSLLDSEYARDD